MEPSTDKLPLLELALQYLKAAAFAPPTKVKEQHKPYGRAAKQGRERKTIKSFTHGYFCIKFIYYSRPRRFYK
jgi:hypothetical protein